MKQIRVSNETHHKLKMLSAEKQMSLDQVIQWLRREDLKERIFKASKLYQYKVIGDRDSYCDYNAGWQDAVKYILDEVNDERTE